MTTETEMAMGVAARCWTDAETSGIEMDAERGFRITKAGVEACSKPKAMPLP